MVNKDVYIYKTVQIKAMKRQDVGFAQILCHNLGYKPKKLLLNT